jgi:exosortase B
MATSAALPPAVRWQDVVTHHWLVLAGLLAMLLPTLFSLARGPWSLESGVHGPIVVATGGWLIYRRMAEIRALKVPGKPWITATGLALGAPAYVFGRAFDFISIEVAALLLVFVAVAHAYFGMRVLRLLWFPVLYLAFVIPVPGWALDAVTLPLKMLVSQVVTDVLGALGYPVARDGVTIYVASYQLLVEDACAGLNSLISLSAIGLFYVYMMRGSNVRYSLLLLALVIPIAIAANMVRVALLVLITFYFGSAAAQGYLHNFAGIVTFVSALLLIFLVDKLLTPLRNALAPKAVPLP